MFSFSAALDAAKSGKRIARSGWNGKGMFVFYRLGDIVPVDIVSSFHSLPASVKDYFVQMYVGFKPLFKDDVPSIKFTPCLCMWTATGEVVNGWLASQTDMLAEDWTILD